jgi:hypothetical protein
MNLQFQLAKSTAVPGESLPAHVKLTAGAEPIRLPAFPDESPAVVITVSTPEGGLVTVANGHDRVRRRPFGGEPMADMPTDELPPNESGELQFDLLEFLDPIEPGEYRVSVGIEFEAVRIESDALPLRILECPIVGMDAVANRVCVPCLHTLVTYDCGQSWRSVLNVRNGLRPDGVLRRHAVDVPPGAHPRISEADFARSGDLDEDTTRWLAWVQDGGLKLIRLTTESPAGSILSPQTPYPLADLAGRPVQHADGTLTCVLLESHENRLHAAQIDVSGTVIKDSVVGRGTAVPLPISVSSRDGILGTAMAANASFPLALVRNQNGGSRMFGIADPRAAGKPGGNARILALRLLEKTVEQDGGAIAAAFLTDAEPKSLGVVRAVYPAVPGGGPGADLEIFSPAARQLLLQPDLMEVPLPRLAASESIVAVDLAQSTAVPVRWPVPWVLLVAVRTSTGRIFTRMPADAKAGWKEMAATSQHGPMLVSAMDGSVFLARASAVGGLAIDRVYEPPVV